MGLENITVSEILKAKGEAEAGAVYWCSTSHFVHEAVQHVSITVFFFWRTTADLPFPPYNYVKKNFPPIIVILQPSDQTLVKTVDDSTQCWSPGGSQVRGHKPACRNCNRER